MIVNVIARARTVPGFSQASNMAWKPGVSWGLAGKPGISPGRAGKSGLAVWPAWLGIKL